MKLKSYSLLAAVAGLLLAGSAQAYLVTNLIDVQYRGSTSNPVSAPADGPGAAFSGGAVLTNNFVSDTWNQEQIGYYSQSPNPYFNGVSLVDASNNASGLTLTLGFNGSNPIQGMNLAAGATPTDAGTTNLMGAAIFIFSVNGAGNPSFTTTHTIGGLSSYNGATFNLVVYAAAPSAQLQNLAITGGASGGNSGSTLYCTNTTRKISDGAGVAYNKFNGTLTGGNLVFTVGSPNAGNFNNAGYVNGFQLQIISTVTDPGITTQPTSKSGFVGGPATFSVTPSGTAPFSYQWQATNAAAANTFTNIGNGGQFTGATTNTLTISSLTTNNALAYRVVVTNVNGAVTSSVASLSVVSQVLVDVDIGSAATQSGAALLGASGDTWNAATGAASNLKDSGNNTLTGVGFTLSGNSGINDNTAGVATYDSNTANLMRDCAYGSPGTTFTTGINGLTNYYNYPFSLVVYAAIGDANQGSSLSLAGATGGNTGSTLVTTGVSRSITNVPPGGIGVAYQTFTGTINAGALTVTASQGSTYHGVNGMQLLLQDPYVLITSQPVSKTNVAGTTANFAVTASGGSLSYQWQANGGAGYTNISGSKIAGATSSSLFITNATANDAISYQVIVSNSFSGAVTSSVASLSLSPAITSQPAALLALLTGDSGSLTVTAAGSPTLAYQWQATNAAAANTFTNVADNAIVTGSGTSTLSFTGATANQALVYRVIVSNGYGTVTSTPPSVVTVSSSPIITVQPISQTNNAGTTVNLSVSVTGSAPLAYQWQANGGAGYTNISNVAPFTGANTNTLVITGISQAQALSYQVIVTNSSGSATSSVATLTVIDPPVITVQPASATVVLNGTTNFSVTATGSAASYQWQAGTGGTYTNLPNGGVVSGATTSTVTLTGVTANYALDYRVILSNAAGSVTSTPAATLTVNIPPSISSQPASTTVINHTLAKLSAVAAGDPTLVYQWQATNAAAANTFTNLVTGGNVAGATASTLYLTNTTATEALAYRLVVSNGSGAVTSSVVTVSLAPSGTTPLYIANNSFESPHSGSQQIFIGGTGGNSTFVTGWTVATTAGYWDLNIPGGGGITNVDGTQVLESYNVGPGVAGAAYQVLTNQWVAGAVYKMTARAGQPTGGNPAHTLDSVSIDTISGSTLSQLSSAALSSSTPGLFNYSVTYTATGSEAGSGFPVVAYHVPSGNGVGGMWVDNFTLTMYTDPLITGQPASVTNTPGSNNSFTVAAGGASLSFQWQANGGSGFTNLSNGGNIWGVTSNVLTITNTTGNQGIAYQVIVSNVFNVVTSSVATLVMPVTISSQPAAVLALLNGDNGSLTVVADGSPTLAYQWQADGGTGYTNVTDNAIVTGSTSSTLTFTGATANQSLSYQVIVSNGYGSVTSAPPSVVAVTSAPVITVQPTSQTNITGATINFSVTATGAGLSYQWQANGGGGYTNLADVGIVSGSQTNTVTLTGVTINDAINYRVVVTNSSGSVTSTVASLTVIVAPTITVQPVSTSGVVGSTLQFSVTAAGGAPYGYKWQASGGAGYTNLLNAGKFSGVTSNILTVTSITTNQALSYQVIVTNAAGSVTSSPAATLTVNVPASITSQPASAAVALGSTATFSVGAAGDATLAYQWQASPTGAGTYTNIVDNGQLSGSASSTLTVTNVNNLVLNDYRVIVTNNYGSATSSVANLAILKLRINVDIGSTTAVQTNGAILGSTGDVWNGVTGSTGTIKDYTGTTQSGVAYAVANNFGFNSGGSTAMDAATTNLMKDCVFGFVGQSASSFPVSLSGLSAYIGSSFTLVVYSGVGDPGQGASLTLAGGSGGTSHNTLLVSADTRQLSAGIGHAYQTFTGTITNGTLTITAAPNVNPTFFGISGFQLQVTATNVPDPVITSQPASRTNAVTTTATFSVTATGSATLSYQWQADGGTGYTNLVDGIVAGGSQSNVLTLTGVSTDDAVSYQVIVANADGSVTSSPAILTVTTLPVINTAPVSQTVLSGGTANFNVSAAGASSYQWQANGGSGYTNLSGGIATGTTTATLTLTGVTTNDAISYQVIAINGSGSVTSSPATLTVLPATTLVNAQFHSGPTGNNGPGYVYTGAGVLGSGGDVWSTYGLAYYVTPDVLFSAVPLTNAAGTANGMNVTVTQNGAANPVYGIDDIAGTAMDAATTNLMAGALESFNFYSNPEVFVVTIGGLSNYTNSAFELVIYAAHNTLTQTLTLTSGATGGNTGSAVTTTATSRKLSDGIGVAYNVFTGTLTNGSLTFKVTSPTGANLAAAMNGFQLLLSPTVAPIITVQPASTAQSTGSNATFNVTAASSSTAGYQWQANGGAGYTNITGATSATLTRTTVTPADAVAYQVIVTNAGGAVTSSVANLTVISDVTAGAPFTLGVVLGSSQTVQIVGGKHAPSNLTGSLLTVTSVTGATNGSVSTDGTSVTYTATNGTADSFTYTVSDTYGGTATQTISVAISTNVQGFNMISAQIILGDAVLTYAGIPGNNYALDETHSLSQPITWTPVTTNGAATNGFLIFTNTPSGTNDFYRTRYVP